MICGWDSLSLGVIQRVNRQDGCAWSIRKRPIIAATSSPRYQVSPQIQRLVVNSPIGNPRASIEIATMWLRASLSLFGGVKSGTGAGLTQEGMPLGRGWE